MTILDQLAAHARQRVAADQEKHSLHELKARCKEAGRAGGERVFQAMKPPGMSFICEVKKASPSKGIIAPNFPYLDIARDYAAAGADAVSCLTEGTQVGVHRGAASEPLLSLSQRTRMGGARRRRPLWQASLSDG